jgi:hypothetical protein
MQLYRIKGNMQGGRPLAFLNYNKYFLLFEQLFLIVPERWLR